MNRIIKLIIPIICLIEFSCGVYLNQKAIVCNCCENTYTSIEDAMNCIKQYPIMNTKADNRLLLFAVINKDIKAQQDLSWNIINDQDIIRVAKQNYLLITLEASELFVIEYNKESSELRETINSYKDESLFFVITNQALLTFADWDSDENKDKIIDYLNIGNGP